MKHAHFYWYMRGHQISQGRLDPETVHWLDYRQTLDEKVFFESIRELQQKSFHPLVIYFHGYMADFIPVNLEITRALDQFILPEESSVVCVHIQWQAFSFYPYVHDWMQKTCIPCLNEVINTLMGLSAKVDVLGHSMGSSLLHYSLENQDWSSHIHKCVLAAPELSFDAFTSSEHWIKMMDRVQVFATNGDLTLTLASWIKRDLKLGLATTAVDEENFPGEVVRDFSKDELWAGKYFRHRYFYTHPEVRSKIHAFYYG